MTLARSFNELEDEDEDKGEDEQDRATRPCRLNRDDDYGTVHSYCAEEEQRQDMASLRLPTFEGQSTLDSDPPNPVILLPTRGGNRGANSPASRVRSAVAWSV